MCQQVLKNVKWFETHVKCSLLTISKPVILQYFIIEDSRVRIIFFVTVERETMYYGFIHVIRC